MMENFRASPVYIGLGRRSLLNRIDERDDHDQRSPQMPFPKAHSMAYRRSKKRVTLPPVCQLIAESDAILARSSGPLPQVKITMPVYRPNFDAGFKKETQVPKLHVRERTAPYPSQRPLEPSLSRLTRRQVAVSRDNRTSDGERSRRSRKRELQRERNYLHSGFPAMSPPELLATLARAFPLSNDLSQTLRPSVSHENGDFQPSGKLCEYESIEVTHLTYRRCNAPTCFFVPRVEIGGVIDQSCKLEVGEGVSKAGNIITFQFCPSTGSVEAGVPLLQIEGDPDRIVGGWDDISKLLSPCPGARASDSEKTRHASDACEEGVKIIVGFDGHTLTKVSREVQLRCLCTGITRARIAYEVLQAFRCYLAVTMPTISIVHSPSSPSMPMKTCDPHRGALQQLRLMSIFSPDGFHWVPNFIVSDA
ncbi:hypothetical protein CPB83DRAFT_74862 [Crepidotus variabilis]|uniref:Uncharacterized protein n=1 Tax=Crepidotus variabilis TaxID=179855 RepID=A0A9P6E5C9_9AGAR|nr:hypothetical protein CPB83DRAFT_74862 [Crepidotus variabilis]